MGLYYPDQRRTLEEIFDEIDKWIDTGMPVSQAMNATLRQREWDDVYTLLRKLQAFWKKHHPECH